MPVTALPVHAMKEAGEQSLYLVIDQGGHASRAFVFDAEGRRVAEGWAPVTTTRPEPGRVEHDAGALRDGVRQAIAAAADALPPGAKLVAAGLATQRSTIVCWNRLSGEALTPAISWQDTRNQPLIEQLAPHAARVRAITGLPLSAHYGASKLSWCLEECPAIGEHLQAGSLAWGPLASYLLHGLLEERPLLADPANAARTLLWDLRRRDWSEEMLRLFGLPGEALPACVDTRAVYGHLLAAGQRVPLRVCTGDQSAVPFAAGWPEPGRVTVNAGTGAFIQRSTGEQPVGNHGLLTSIIYSDRDRAAYTLEGTVNGAGAAIEMMAAELGIEPEAALAALEPGDDQVPLFINAVGGLGSPFWQPELRSRFEGNGSPSQKMQAVFESVLFLIQTNLDALRAATGAVEHIVVTGGLSRQELFRQGLADLSGVPVLHPDRPEATARGVAFLLSQERGRWPDAAAHANAPRSNPGLTRRYSRWQEAMARAMAGAMSKTMTRTLD